MNFFLVQLSVSDIMTAVLTLVPEIVWTITMPAFWGGGAVCKLIKFLQVSLDQASTFFVGGGESKTYNVFVSCFNPN